MSANVIKLSENVFCRKSTECEEEVIQNEETFKRDSINKVDSRVNNPDYIKITSLDTNADVHFDPTTQTTNLDKNTEDKKNHRFSDGFIRELTLGATKNVNHYKIEENIFDNDIKDTNQMNKSKEEFIFIPPKNQDNNFQNYTNLYCCKFFLPDDFFKDVYFLFIDPKSEIGASLLLMDINGIKFDDFSSLAFIVNFKDTCKFKLGIDMLKEYQGSSAKKTRILIGGGDEMIINCIEDLRNNAIDLTRCLFGVIPIGFTNNLSKTLQFNNNSQIGTDMKYFKTLLESYNKAKEVEIDIWKLDLTLHSEGGVFKFENGKKIELLDENSNNIVKMVKPFINYFTIGYDARVGYGLDKSSSKNCLMFVWESIKKMICTRTMPLNEYLEVFISEDKEIFKSENDNKGKTVKYSYSKDRLVLRDQPNTLICQNINCYLGNSHIWEKSKKRIGLSFEEEGKASKKDKQMKQTDERIFFDDLINSEQRLDDQQLEFFTYKNGFLLICDKLFGKGLADKIHQSKGPFIIKFKKILTKSLNDKHHRIYLKVDGENYFLVHPDNIRISLNPNYPRGLVKFLACN